MSVEDLASIEQLPREWPAFGRLRRAFLLNVLLPGAGLVALQRAFPGVVLGTLFLLSAETALLGLLIVPRLLAAAAPAAAIFAGAFWLVGQVLLLRRSRELQDGQLRLHASTRIEQARQAVVAGEWADAGELLSDAAGYDDEQPDLNWLLAQVHSAVRPHKQALRQWRRLDQVDARGRYQEEIRRATAGGVIDRSNSRDRAVG